MDQQNEGEMMEIDDIWDDEEDRENVRNYGLQPSPPSAEKRMMDDRELLKLAANAAGMMFIDDRESGLTIQRGHDGCPYNYAWNPLTDDGDALRLACKLYIHVNLFPPLESDLPMGVPGFVEAWQWNGDDPVHVEYIDKGGSYEVATRRAIVRAAAELARAGAQKG